jgi:hypothetical protein
VSTFSVLQVKKVIDLGSEKLVKKTRYLAELSRSPVKNDANDAHRPPPSAMPFVGADNVEMLLL